MSNARIPVASLLMVGVCVASSLATTITFDTDDDGSPLLNGQIVYAPNAFGTVFDIISVGPNLGATVFDSDPFGPNMSSLDQDLLINSTNILILQDQSLPGMSDPGIFDEPNDANEGGALTFDFSPANFAVGLETIDVIDMDEGNLLTFTLEDEMGLLRIIDIPAGFTGDIRFGAIGIATIDFAAGAQESPNIPGLFTQVTSEAGFNLGDVVSLEAAFQGSGALDNLVFIPEPMTGLLLAAGAVALARRRR